MSFHDVSVLPYDTSGSRVEHGPRNTTPWPLRYVIFKRIVDLHFALIALPSILFVSLVLLVLNPFWNAGPLFYGQDRMGQGGVPFRLWKFRTMVPEAGAARLPSGALEEERITSLGRFLRRSRLDELPNFLNVLRGEMSVIGPRPDMVDHARAFAKLVPPYASRLRVKPGITGLAQVRQGYVDTLDDVLQKVRHDQTYIEQGSPRLDMVIVAQTIWVMSTGYGGR